MLIDIDLNILIKYLGNPTKKLGDEYIWQCPYCMDSHKDNLKYNEKKRVLKCFANDTHAGNVLRDLNKALGINTPKNTEPLPVRLTNTPELTKEQSEENLYYMLACERELGDNPKGFEHLERKRGITKETAKRYGIGIDKEQQSWVIPIWRYSLVDPIEILGFEYRPALLPNAIKEKRTEQEKQAKKGIRRKKGSISGLAMINCQTPTAENLIIVEGFFDGMALWQHLEETLELQLYHIVTPSNGISSLMKQIGTIDFSAYKRFYIYIDADETGKQILKEVLEKYPFFEPIQLDCGCKDFNEHYLKCIKQIA